MRTTLRTCSLAGLLLVFAQAVFASALGYPFRLQDDSGNLLPGATITVNGTAVAASTNGAAPTYVAANVLSAFNFGVINGVNVAIYGAGTGDYLLVYDAEANGDAYIALSVSKAGSTITQGNALVSIIATRESGRILNNVDAQVSTRSTYAGTDTAGTTTLLSRIPGTIQPQTGDVYARIGVAGAGLTAIGDTRLAFLDANVSSRSTYAGTDTAGTTTLLTRLTGARAANLDYLDTALSTGFAAIPNSILGATAASYSGAGSIGQKINAAGAAGNPWTTDISSGYTGTQAGNILYAIRSGQPVTLPTTAPAGYGGSAGSDPWGVLLTAETTPNSFGTWIKSLLPGTSPVVLPTTPPAGYGGSGGDPWATLLTAETTTGSFGAFFKAQLVNPVPSDYQQRGVAVTLPAGVSNFYAPVTFGGSAATASLVITITPNGAGKPVLSWTADSLATSYKVLRSTDGVSYTVIASGLTATTYTDATTVSGTQYRFAIISLH